MIILLGSYGHHLGGTEYLKTWHNLIVGDAPDINLSDEKNLQASCLKMIKSGYVKSAHDVSEGGFASSLAECCISGASGIGAWVEFKQNHRRDAALFGEDQSRIIISAHPKNLSHIQRIAADYNVQANVVGETGGSELMIGSIVKLKITTLKAAYEGTLERLLERE